MALILNEKYTGPRSTWVFSTNRFLKLYPLYWYVLLMSVMVSASSALCIRPDQSLCLQSWLKHGTNLSFLQNLYLIGVNLTIFGQDTTLFLKFNFSSGFFSPTTNLWETKPMVWNFLLIPPAWTLGVELLFYSVAPLIVRRHVAKILTLLTLSLAPRVVLYHGGLSGDPWNYRFFPVELAFFCAGSVAYSSWRALRTATIPAWLPFTATIGIMGLLLGFNYLPGAYPVRQWCFYAVFVIAVPSCLSIEGQVRRSLSW